MFHQTQIIGNLGQDPVLRYTGSGSPVTSFSVASNRRYNKSDGTQIEETAWFRISVWGRQAEICQKHLSKGRQVFVQGKLAVDRATGGPRVFQRQDGTAGSSFEVNADVVRFLGSNGKQEEIAGEPEPEEAPAV
jgi:single-strand DNA-binding protein